MIRLLEDRKRSRSRSSSRKPKLEEGAKVEANYRGRGRFYPGRIKAVRLDGTFDVDYDNGESESHVGYASIRELKSSSYRDLSSRSKTFVAGQAVESNYRGRGKWLPGHIKLVRLDGTYDVDFDEDNLTESHVSPRDIRVIPSFPLGSLVFCAFYKSSSLSKPIVQTTSLPGFVLRCYDDDLFDVELLNGLLCPQVPKLYLSFKAKKNIPAEAKYQTMINSLLLMAKYNYDNSETSDDVEHQYSYLLKILGAKTFKKFFGTFEQIVPKTGWSYQDFEKAFQILGGVISAREIQSWAEEHFPDRNWKKPWNLFEFLLTYSSLFYPFSTKADGIESEVTSLELDKRFGKVVANALERIFLQNSSKDHNGLYLISGSSLLECLRFFNVKASAQQICGHLKCDDLNGISIPFSKFVELYQNFSNNKTGNNSDVSPSIPLAVLAAALAQQTEWIPNDINYASLAKKLSSGRNEALAVKINQIIESFDKVDRHGKGIISISEVRLLFRNINMEMKSVHRKIEQLQSSRGDAMLNILEIFEKFGSIIEEYTDRNLTIEEVVSYLTTYNSVSNTNNALIFLTEVLQRIVEHPNDVKYRTLNYDNDKLERTIISLEGGEKLLHAVGFSEPTFDVLRKKTFITWQVSQSSNNTALSQRDMEKINAIIKEMNAQQRRCLGGAILRDILKVMRKTYSAKVLIIALETLHQIILNLLQHSHDYSKYRLKMDNRIFLQRLGHLDGSEKLMNAIGFTNHQGNVYIFNNDESKSNDTAAAPQLNEENKRFLLRRKIEIESALEMFETEAVEATTAASKTSKPSSKIQSGKAGISNNKVTKNVPTQQKPNNAIDIKFGKANKTVIDLLKKVFNNLDKDQDGFITEEDVISQFREAGIFRNRHQAKMWISAKDIDQDGKLSMEEFLAEYLLEYDRHHKEKSINYNSLNLALGYLRLNTSLQISMLIGDSIIEHLSKILKNPNVVSSRVIEVTEKDFGAINFEKIRDIYLAVGFNNHQNEKNKFIYGAAMGKLSDAQIQGLEENYKVIHHFVSLLIDPSLSDPLNVPAALIHMCIVEKKMTTEFLQIVENILSNILKHPKMLLYYKVNLNNDIFYKSLKEAKFGLQLLQYVGFENAEDSNLILPIETDLGIIHARKMEIDLVIKRVNHEKGLVPLKDAKNLVSSKSSSIQTQTAQAAQAATSERKKIQSEAVKQDRVLMQSLKQQQGMIKQLKKEVQYLKEKKQENNPSNWAIKPSEVTASAASKPSTSSTSASIPDYLASLGESFLQFKLTRPVSPGTSLLEIENNKGLKPGMIIVFGSGEQLEMNRIKALGSIVTERPVTYRHSAGTVLYIYQNKKLLIPKIQKIITGCFIASLLKNDIIDAAITTAIKKKRKYKLDRKVTYFMRLQRSPRISNSFFQLSYQHLRSHQYRFLSVQPHSTADGSIHLSLQQATNSPNILQFVRMFLLLTNFAVTSAASVSIEAALIEIEKTDELYCFFEAARLHYNSPSIEEVILMFLDPESEMIVWDLFLSLWLGQLTKSRIDHYKSLLPSASIKLELYTLMLLFDMSVIQRDTHLMTRGQLINCFALLDDGQLPSNLDVMEGETVDFSQFVQIRNQFVAENRQAKISIGHTLLAVDEITNVHRHTLSLVSLPSASTSPEVSKAEVIKIYVNAKLGALYSLDWDGCLTIINMSSNETLLRKRVFFLESLCQGLMEGPDQFSSFLQSANLTSLEVESATCFKFFYKLFFDYSLPVTLLHFDPDSGLLACNSSLMGGAVCFYDPLTLTRLYRIKSPVPINTTGHELLSAITRDASSKLGDFVAARDNLVSFFAINSQYSFLITKVSSASDIQILDLFSGNLLRTIQLIIEIPLTTFHFIEEVTQLVLGFESGLVCVWNVLDLLRKRKQTFDRPPSIAESILLGASRRNEIDNNFIEKFLAIIRSENPSNFRWTRGKIVNVKKVDTHNPAKQITVEVLLLNGELKCIDNLQLLRNPDEPKIAPRGPPIWRNPSVSIAIGEEVALYDFHFSSFIQEIQKLRLWKDRSIHKKYRKDKLSSLLHQIDFIGKNFTLNQVLTVVDSFLSNEQAHLSVFELFFLCFNQQSRLSDLPLMICNSTHPITHIEIIQPDILVAMDLNNSITVCKIPSKKADTSELQLLHHGSIAGRETGFIFTDPYTRIANICSEQRSKLDGNLKIHFNYEQIKEAIRADLTNRDYPYRGFIFELKNGKMFTVEVNGFALDFINLLRLQSISNILHHSSYSPSHHEHTPATVFYKYRFQLRSIKYILYQKRPLQQQQSTPAVRTLGFTTANSVSLFTETIGTILSQKGMDKLTTTNKCFLFDVAEVEITTPCFRRKMKKPMLLKFMKRQNERSQLQRNMISNFCRVTKLSNQNKVIIPRNLFLSSCLEITNDSYHSLQNYFDLFHGLRNQQQDRHLNEVHNEVMNLRSLTLQEFEMSKNISDIVILRTQGGIGMKLYQFLAHFVKYYSLLEHTNHPLFTLLMNVAFQGILPTEESTDEQLLSQLSRILFTDNQAFKADLLLLSGISKAFPLNKLFSQLHAEDIAVLTDVERLLPDKMNDGAIAPLENETIFQLLCKQRVTNLRPFHDHAYSHIRILFLLSEVLLKQITSDKPQQVVEESEPLEIITSKDYRPLRSKAFESTLEDHFDIIAETELFSFFPSIGISIASCRKVSERVVTEDYVFMVWRATGDINITAWRSSLLRLKEKLHTSMLSCLFVPISVSFRGETGAPMLVYRWSNSFVSLTQLLHELLTSSCSTSRTTINYHNMLATVIQAVIDIKKEFGAINCISTDNFFLNINTGELKVLLLPTVFEADYLKKLYIQYNQSHPDRSCFIDFVRVKQSDWSAWIIRMLLLVFSIGFPPVISSNIGGPNVLRSADPSQRLLSLIAETLLSKQTNNTGREENSKEAYHLHSLLQSLKFFVVNQSKLDHQIQMNAPQSTSSLSASHLTQSFSSTKMLLLPLCLQIRSFLRKKKVFPSSFHNKDMKTAIAMIQAIIGTELDKKIIEIFFKLLSSVFGSVGGGKDKKAISLIEELNILAGVAQLVGIIDILDPITELKSSIDLFEFPLPIFGQNDHQGNFEQQLLQLHQFPSTIRKLRKLKDSDEIYYQLSYIENFTPANINVHYPLLATATTLTASGHSFSEAGNTSNLTVTGGGDFGQFNQMKQDISTYLSSLQQQAIMIYSLPALTFHHQPTPFHEGKLLHLSTEFEQLFFFLDHNAEKISKIIDPDNQMVSFSRCNLKHQLLQLYDISLTATVSYWTGELPLPTRNRNKNPKQNISQMVIESSVHTNFNTNTLLFKVIEEYLSKATSLKPTTHHSHGKTTAIVSSHQSLFQSIVQHHRFLYEYVPLTYQSTSISQPYGSEYFTIFMKIMSEIAGIRIFHQNLTKKKHLLIKSIASFLHNHQYKQQYPPSHHQKNNNTTHYHSSFFVLFQEIKLTQINFPYYNCMKAFYDTAIPRKLSQVFSSLYYHSDLLVTMMEFYQQLLHSFLQFNDRSEENRFLMELSLQFTSFPWIGGWLKILKRYAIQSIPNTSMITSLLTIFQLITCKRIWTRSWKALNVIKTLQLILKKLKNLPYYEEMMDHIFSAYNHDAYLETKLKQFDSSSSFVSIRDPDGRSEGEDGEQEEYQEGFHYFTLLLDQFTSLQKVGTLLEHDQILTKTFSILQLWEDQIKYCLQYSIPPLSSPTFPANYVLRFCQHLIPLLYNILSKELLDFHYLFDDSHSTTIPATSSSANIAQERLEKLYAMIHGKYSLLEKSIQLLHLLSLEEYQKMILNNFPSPKLTQTQTMTQFLENTSTTSTATHYYQEYQPDSINLLQHLFSNTMKVSRFMKLNILRLNMMNRYLQIISKLFITQITLEFSSSSSYSASSSSSFAKNNNYNTTTVLSSTTAGATVKEGNRDHDLRTVLLYEILLKGLYALMFNLQKALLVHSNISLQTIEMQHFFTSIQFYWKILIQYSTFFLLEQSFIQQQMMDIIDQWLFLTSHTAETDSLTATGRGGGGGSGGNESLAKHEYRTILIQETIKISFQILLFNPNYSSSSPSSINNTNNNNINNNNNNKSFLQYALLNYLQQEEKIQQLKDIFFSPTISHQSFLKTILSYFFTLLCNLPEYSFARRFEDHFVIKELMEYIQQQTIYEFYDCMDIWQYCKRIMHFPPEDIAFQHYMETNHLQNQLLSTLPPPSTTKATTPGKPSQTKSASKSLKAVDKKSSKGPKKGAAATSKDDEQQHHPATMMKPDKFQFYVQLIGDFLIGIKRLFDAKGQVSSHHQLPPPPSSSSTSALTASKTHPVIQKVVRPEVISGLLLDLGIHHDGFLKGRNAVQDFIALSPDMEVEDIVFTFHQFLQIYFISCNLPIIVDYPPTHPKETLPRVIPNVFTGLWEVVDEATVRKMEKGMLQYARENPSIFLFLDAKEIPQAINCRTSDVISLMMIVGLELEVQLYHHVLNKLKHFIETGKPDTFSFQSLLAIFCNCIYGQEHRKEILLP